MSSFFSFNHNSLKDHATLASVLTVLTACLAGLRFIEGGVNVISIALSFTAFCYFAMAVLERRGFSPSTLLIPSIACVTLSVLAFAEGGLWSDASIWFPFVPLVAVVVGQKRAALPLFLFVTIVLITLLASHIGGLIGERSVQASILHFSSLMGASVFGISLALRVKHEHSVVEQTLLEKTRRDPLTGLLNRRGLEDIAPSLGQGSVGVLYLDLDGLKRINDTLGHEEGDAAITRTAKLIRDCMRQGDHCARLGGDEFVVVMPMIKTESQASRAATRLLESLNQKEHSARHALKGSIGVSFAEQAHAQALGSLIEAADRAMYCAKQKGGNSISLSERDPHQDGVNKS